MFYSFVRSSSLSDEVIGRVAIKICFPHDFYQISLFWEYYIIVIYRPIKFNFFCNIFDEKSLKCGFKTIVKICTETVYSVNLKVSEI